MYPDLQARRRCTLPGYTGAWGADEKIVPEDYRLRIWQGRDPEGHDMRPHEKRSEGCPGGWARSRFAQSLLRYRRGRLEGGGHDSNPLVHANTDRFILECLALFEGYEAVAAAEFRKAIYG